MTQPSHPSPDSTSGPDGVTLRRALGGHANVILRIAWSRDGTKIASPSVDHTIKIWDAESGEERARLVGHAHGANHAAWSPDDATLVSVSFDRTVRVWDVASARQIGQLNDHVDDIGSVSWSHDGGLVATGSNDRTIRLWDAATWTTRRVLDGHRDAVTRVAWSRASIRRLASCSMDGTIRLWDADTGQTEAVLQGHADRVICVVWSPDGRLLASTSFDRTVRIWDAGSGQHLRILEGHLNTVTSASFSFDGRLLASKSVDGTVCLRRTDSWEPVAVVHEEAAHFWPPGLEFHPHAPRLATLGQRDRILRLWDVDIDALRGAAPTVATVAYTSAKVALVGDTGVGKSGLALTLTGQGFLPTESTHGRRVVTLELSEGTTNDGTREIREALLWDLAGQPGYRLIHQLHLHELALALVVFDARSETDPFAGVRHWDRALRQAKHTQGGGGWPLKKILVEARIDRSGVGASAARIETIVRTLGFDGYFRTSAKEGQGIDELAAAIRRAISWEALPQVSSTELFGSIRSFLVGEKETGRLLAGMDDLYRAFERSSFAPGHVDDLRAQFETGIRLMEAHDVIRRLSFGNLVLLQPEMLDAYASALVNAARDEPDGLGSIAEEDARAGRFTMPTGVPKADDDQVKLLLIAMVEDLLRFEIVLREQAEDGPYLVFPSQLTREHPNMPEPEGKSVVYAFEGPVASAYATLAVRLAHSGTFTRKEMWKNAVTYTAQTGGTCGLFLKEVEEGRGELTLFFDQAAGSETRALFSAYVHAHLRRRALPESVERRLVPVCTGCGLVVTDQQLQILRGRGQDRMTCPACQTTVWLVERAEQPPEAERHSLVQAMDTCADDWRQRDRARSIIVGKRATNDYDVFISYNRRDRTAALELRERLLERGILPWIDRYDMPPFTRWQDELERIIQRVKSAAALVGPHGLGPWEDVEVNALLEEFVRRRVRIGVVQLPGCPDEPNVPVFLRSLTRVDLREGSPEALDRLVWGITGDRAPLRSQSLASDDP